MTPATVAKVLTDASVEAEDAWVVTLLRVANAHDLIARIARLVVDVVVAVTLELCTKKTTTTAHTHVTCCSDSCIAHIFVRLQDVT